jgi:hypothetical protein
LYNEDSTTEYVGTTKHGASDNKGEGEDEDDTVALKRAQSTVLESYIPIMLSFTRNNELIVVGVVALLRSDAPIRSIDFEFISDIVQSLYDAGDIRSTKGVLSCAG